MARPAKKTIIDYLDEQRRWIAEHGGDLIGYVTRYGSKDDARHYGDGGELIYAADMAALRRLERGRLR